MNDNFTERGDIHFSVEMSSEAFASVNVPVAVFSIITNIIFVFFMVFPPKGTERLKQPLNVLLGVLVGCNVAAHVCVLVMAFCNLFSFDLFVCWFVPPIALYTMMTSVNSSQWLNIFYCVQIIPVQHPSFRWLKRNIRILINSAFIVNAAVCLLGMSINVAYFIIDNKGNLNDQKTDRKNLDKTDKAGFYMILTLFSLSLCLMLVSSCATAVFLWRHMKTTEKSSGSPYHLRQMRVTVISISVQALLHVFCSSFVVIDLLLNFQLKFDTEANILCTIISLYSFGTTINLGVSQSVIRQRAVHVWHKFRPSRSLSVATIVRSISSDMLSS